MITILRMHARVVGIVLTIVSQTYAEIPNELLNNLSSDSFRVRESAEQDLATWAFENHGEALSLLYQTTREHPDAEIRIRCLSVLRQLVDDIYDSEGEGYVGIRMKDETIRLPKQQKPVEVLEVVEVVTDSPASKAGLLVGDIIVSLGQGDWTSLPASDDFRNRVKLLKPRTEVSVKVLRGEEYLEIKIRLARRPALLEQIFEMPRQQRIDAMEENLREEHFKKWLLDRKNDR